MYCLLITLNNSLDRYRTKNLTLHYRIKFLTHEYRQHHLFQRIAVLASF